MHILGVARAPEMRRGKYFCFCCSLALRTSCNSKSEWQTHSRHRLGSRARVLGQQQRTARTVLPFIRIARHTCPSTLAAESMLSAHCTPH